MKNRLKILGTVFIIFFLMGLKGCMISEPVYPQQLTISFQTFYDELSPYGRWVDYPAYGFAWVPTGYPGFYPYATDGYWAYTEFGWTWVSHYSWGWGPFHYGRWFFDVALGWIWIPGTEWGPAWVVWADAPGYYGWVPMFPGYGYHMHSYPVDYWTFVQANDFGKKDFYYGPRKSNSALVKNANLIENKNVEKTRNTTYYSGPRLDEVQKSTGRQIQPITIQDAGKPSQVARNSHLKLYRPEVQKREQPGKAEVPKKISRIEDIKPITIPKGTGKPDIQVTPRDKTYVPKPKELPKRGEQLPVVIPEKEKINIERERRKPVQVAPTEKDKNIHAVPQKREQQGQPEPKAIPRQQEQGEQKQIKEKPRAQPREQQAQEQKQEVQLDLPRQKQVLRPRPQPQLQRKTLPWIRKESQ